MTAPLDAYRQAFDTTWSDDTPIDQVRFVILDSETSGLNAEVDPIITIGAVAVQAGEIVLEDQFASLIQVDDTGTVTVHGVTRDQSRGGIDERVALERFLGYLRDGVIVGHHIGHDITAFDAGYERHFGMRLLNRSLDTMDLTLHLEQDGAFATGPPIRQFTLDSLCERFGVVPHDRHTAAGDAFITAQVFQRLLRLASRHGRDRLGLLCEPFESEVNREAREEL